MSESIEITIGKTSIITTRDADVCVVYLGSIGEDEHRHTAPFGVHNKGQQPIMFEPGGSLVNAGLLHDHLANPHPAFARKLEASEFELHEDAAQALEGSAAKAADVVRLTRHARTLRLWLDAEQAREPKRKRLIDGIKERLRLYADHSTPVPTILTFTRPERPAETAAPARGRRAS